MLALRDDRDTSTNITGPLVVPPVADTTASVDAFQHAAHVPCRPSPAASTSQPASAASDPSATSHLRHPLTSNNLLPPPPAAEREHDSVRDVTVTGGSGQPKDESLNNLDVAGRASTSTSLDLLSAPSSRPGSVAMPVSRPTVIGAMKPKRGPSVPQGTKRVTRSVSVKEQRVKCERAEIQDTTVEGKGHLRALLIFIRSKYSRCLSVPTATTGAVAGPSSEVAEMPPPSSTVLSKLRPPKPTGAVAKSKIPSTRHRSASVSKLPPDSSNLKQTSLHAFVKGKLPTAGGAGTASDSTISTSTSTGGSSRAAPVPSPSKIPLPTSPLKRPSTSQPGNTKPYLFSLGSTSIGSGTGATRGPSGRSLTTLSHALDKLAALPPSRPNTSMGFVRAERPSEEDNTPEKVNGKGKAKDDGSLHLTSTAQGTGTTFARPTASSLKRSATVTGFGSTAVARMPGRGGAGFGGPAQGRGIFGRVGDRASKKTTLPVVAGSPVKGTGATGDVDGDDREAGKRESRLSWNGAKDVADEEDVFGSQDVVMQDVSAESLTGGGGSAASHKPSPPVAAHANSAIEVDLTSSPISVDKGKQRAVPPSTLNPASSALHALSESLSSLPQTPTPPKPKAVGTRTGLRSSSAATGKESPALAGSGSAGPGGNSDVHGSGGAGPSGTVDGSGGVKKSSLKILKRCAIFVDVRTEQGDDAGSLFVDMLKGLGAKVRIVPRRLFYCAVSLMDMGI